MVKRLTGWRGVVGLMVVLAVWMGSGRVAEGAVVTRAVLKEFFQSGDKPTAQQFSTLLDSMVNYTDDRYLLGLRSYDPAKTYVTGDTLRLKRFGIGDATPEDPTGYTDRTGLVLDMETEFAGQSGFLLMTLGDSLGQVYYGYMQLAMEPVGSSGPPAIDVQYVVFETSPNTALTVSEVPEAGTLGMLGLGVLGLVGRRRRRAEVGD